MKFLANENFPLTSIKILKDKGYDTLSVGVDYQGILDIEVIELSIKQNRTIITFDRDYGELIFKHGYKPQAGVIYLRWENFLPNEPGQFLIRLFASKTFKFNRKLTVISEGNIRQRSY